MSNKLYTDYDKYKAYKNGEYMLWNKTTVYQCVEDALPNQTPITHPNKWKIAFSSGGGGVNSVTGLNTDNSDPSNPIVKISVDGTTITGNGTPLSPLQAISGGGTVTSVGLQLGTSGNDANVSGSPITTNGNITLNLPSASATKRGLLTPADWITFNNKQDPITPAALTKTDDTNVTLTLSGSPSTSLLQPVNLTLGWTGTLADSRIASAAIWHAKKTDSMSSNRLLGRTTAGTGAIEELQAGVGLSLSNGYLDLAPYTSINYIYPSNYNRVPMPIGAVIASQTGGSTASNSNVWFLIPRFFSSNTSVSKVGIRISAFTSNQDFRIAIYDTVWNPSQCAYLPNNRIVNSGAITVVGTGFYEYVFPSSVVLNGWCYFAIAFAGTGFSYRNIGTAQYLAVPFVTYSTSPINTESNQIVGSYLVNTTNSRTADPPAVWSGTLTADNGTNCPSLYFYVD